MHGDMGQYGENNGFQSRIWIAVMLRCDDRYGLKPLAKELHEQWVFCPSATDDDLVDRLLWKNKALVVEGDRLDSKCRAGASDVGWAKVESGGAVANMLP